MTLALLKKKIPNFRILDFQHMIKRISDRYGREAAIAWTKAVTQYEKQINEDVLRSAIASKSIKNIESAVAPSILQRKVEKALVPPLGSSAVAAGHGGATMLQRSGVAMQFNAAHANVSLYARQRAAAMVVGIDRETKAVIGEVIARGAERGLTIEQQARAIREVVGLPPAWAGAPAALEDDLRAGRIASATGRKMSARLKQEIRSAAANDKMTEAFIAKATKEYSETLINLRATTIARTETLRAAHHGLEESWQQAKDQGVLPSTTRRFWIVTPDDRLCFICVRIPGMNADGVELGQPFLTPEGPVDAPPAPHPNCRCAMGLGFGANPVRADRVAGAPLESIQPGGKVPDIAKRLPEVWASLSPLEQQRLAFVKVVRPAGGTVPLYEGGRQVNAYYDFRRSRLTLPKGAAPSTITHEVAHAVDHSFGGGAFGFLSSDTVFSQSVQKGLQKGTVYTDQIISKYASDAAQAQEVFADLFSVTRLGVDSVRGGTVTAAELRKQFPDAAAWISRRLPRNAPAPLTRIARVAELPKGVPAEIHKAVSEVLNDMEIQRAKVHYSTKLGKDSVGKFSGSVLGMYNKGKISLDPRLPIKMIRQTVAHEAEHLKFDIALQADKKLKGDILNDWKGLQKDDGVTKYSTAHWNKAGLLDEMFGDLHGSQGWYKLLPVNETLAEMRAMEAAGRKVGSTRYRSLLRRVDKAYEKGATKGVRFGNAKAARRLEPLPVRHPSMRALGYPSEAPFARKPIVGTTSSSVTTTVESQRGVSSIPQVWDKMTEAERQMIAEVRVKRESGKTLISSRGRPAAGTYSWEDRTIRLPAQGNWRTAAHEVGHAIDHAIAGGTERFLAFASDNSEFQRAVSVGLQRSSDTYYTKLVTGSYAKDRHAREVFADIYAALRAKARVRTDLISPTALKKQFPEAWKWVEKRLASGVTP